MMLFWSFLIFVIILHKSNAAEDLQKLCKGQRYGTLVANPNDCNSFYVCQFVVQLTKCDIGLHFDRRNKVCNWPQFAGCDWVEVEGSSSGETPNSNDDKYPVVDPNKPSPTEEHPLPNEPEEPKHPEEGNVTEPSENKTPEGGPSSEESEESKKPDNTVTENDVITANPVEPNTSSEENHDNQNNHPSTDDDVITDEPQTPNSNQNPTVDDVITDEPQTPNSNQNPTVDDVITDETQTPNSNQNPTVDDVITDEPQTPNSNQNPTVDDVITDEPQTPNSNQNPTVDDFITQTPLVNSAESGEAITPSLPIPDHPHQPTSPPSSEETDEKPSEGNQDSNEIDEGNKPDSTETPNIDENVTEPDAEGSTDAGDHSSQHWNLIASIVSVESSNSDGFINHPTVGAHSSETGYPVDFMTGYDPKNVQCLHSGLYFLPHPSNCQKYFICAYRHLHLHSCGNGVIWNHKREQCDLKGNSKCYSRDAESEDNTELPTPFVDYQTAKPTRKPTSKTTKIPATTVSHKVPICPQTRQVYLPSLDDCHKYYICIIGKPVLTSCPTGMHWDAVGEFCGEPSVVKCAHR